MGFERDFLEGTVYLSTFQFLRERSVEAISVAAQMRARGSSVLSALSLYIERASCPLPVHANVFVLTRFVVVFGRFTRAFVSFVLETAQVVFTICGDLSSPTKFL